MTTGRIKEVTFVEGIETDPSGIVEIGVTGWNSSATYGINDTISYSGSFYRSLQNSNTNHQPDTSPTWWEVVSLDGDALVQTKEQASTPSNPPTGYYKVFVDKNGKVRKLDSSGTLEFLGGDIEWSTTRDYAVNEVVSIAGIFYRSLQTPNLNKTPASEPTYWRPVSITTEDALVFKERTTAPTTPTTDQYKLYIKDDGKPYIINDAGVEKVIGGGLIVVEADHTEAVGGSGTDLTLKAGNYYIIDISGVLDADGNINTDSDTGLSVIDFNIEAGALESVLGVQVIGQSQQDSGNAEPVYVRLLPNGVQTIWEKETSSTALIVGANASTTNLSWDTTKNWVSNTSDLFVPNTFLGTLYVDAVNFGQDDLNTYENGTHTTTFTCGTTVSSSVDLRYTKIGRVVHLEIPNVNITPSVLDTNLVMNTLLPSGLRTTKTMTFPCGVIDNGTAIADSGNILMTPSGSLQIYKSQTYSDQYSTSGNAGLYQTNYISYMI